MVEMTDKAAAESEPVAIVGGGPVGLLMSLLLARQGVRSVVLERQPQRSSAPKAHALNPRSLEICRAGGLDMAAIYARATPTEEGARVRFATRLLGEELASMAYERQDEAVKALTPTPLINIAQPDFEAVLLDAVAREPLIDLRRGHRWASASQGPEGVVSTVVGPDEREQQVASRFLVACDGAGSPVRTALGVEMEGAGRAVHNVNIHFTADLEARLRGREAVLYWNLDPSAPGTFIAYRIGRNMVFVHNHDPVAEPPASFTPERRRELVAAAIGDPSVPFEVHGASAWVMVSEVAASYRQGRIFLAGDAAHRFPPAGGLGLNTGVADAHNLAWKLAAVLQGRAAPSLLDTYEDERRPVAAANSAQSSVNARGIGQMFKAIGRADGFYERVAEPAQRAAMVEAIMAQRDHFDSLALQLGYVYGEETPPAHVSVYTPSARPGARTPHAWVSRGGTRLSTLDLLSDRRFTLIAGADADAWREQATAARQDIGVLTIGRDFDDPGGEWAKLCGLSPRGALLVRPDAHVALRAEGEPEGPLDLQQALSRLMGEPVPLALAQ